MSRRLIVLPPSGVAMLTAKLSDMAPELVLTVKSLPDPPTFDIQEFLREDASPRLPKPKPMPGTKAYRIANKKWRKK